jgi:hypothetical protein
VKGGEQKPGSGSSIPTLAEGATPSIRLKASSGIPAAMRLGGRSEQAVAALDVGVEEAERSARLQRLHPEGDPQSSTAIGLTSTP